MKESWTTATKEVQAIKLDDRPLYWARNKMQTYLKRHPSYKSDYDLKESTVTGGSPLDKILTLFEEKSRNYKGIDFSKAGKKKKVLITGFDPFVLNQIKYDWAHIDTQNPSGISALYFHGKTLGNAFIQVALIPVRYEDFDKGIIEDITEENISTFDIMMTLSLNSDKFDLERFASKHRKGFIDNINVGNSRLYLNNNDWNKSKFHQIQSGNEFYETTLPIKKIMSGELDITKDIIYYDQSVKDDKGFQVKHPTEGGYNKEKDSFSIKKLKGKSLEGSGGTYLSNEIMYRATRKRDELKLTGSKAIGHVHVKKGLSPTKINDVISKIIQNATK